MAGNELRVSGEVRCVTQSQPWPPNSGYPMPPRPVPPRPRTGIVLAWIFGSLGAIVLLLVVVVFAIAVGSVTAAPSTTSGPQPAFAGGQVPAGPASNVADGTYEVGVDIVPGKYKTAGEPSCYWEVSAHHNGAFGDIVNNSFAPGPQTVTIRSGQYFETRDCGIWSKVS